MTEPNAPPRGPMPVTLLLDEALRQTRTHFRAIFPAVGVPMALLTTFVAVFQAFGIQDLMAGGDPVRAMWTPPIILAALLLLLLAVLSYVAGQAAALDALAGRPVNMKRAWRFAFQPAVLGTCLLLGLVLVALALIFVLLMFLVAFNTTIVRYFFIPLAAVACVVTVFYVASLLSFVVPVMTEEGKFGAGALSRSAKLARFNPSRRLWEHPIVKILLLTLVTTLLSYVAGFVVALPFQLPMFIDVFRKIMSGKEDLAGVMARWIWLQIPSQFLSSLARMAIYIYSAFGTALLYSDVRGRKEGIDLRPEIDALFPAPPAPSAPGEPWS